MPGVKTSGKRPYIQAVHDPPYPAPHKTKKIIGTHINGGSFSSWEDPAWGALLTAKETITRLEFVEVEEYAESLCIEEKKSATDLEENSVLKRERGP